MEGVNQGEFYDNRDAVSLCSTLDVYSKKKALSRLISIGIIVQHSLEQFRPGMCKLLSARAIFTNSKSF